MKLTKPDKIPFTLENLIKHQVLTQDKADIYWHKATRKIVVAGKETGKTFPTAVKAIFQMVNNPKMNGFAARKHKEKAVTQLTNYFSYAQSYLLALGFDLGDAPFELRKYCYTRMKEKRNMENNQKIFYGSNEDISGSTDGAAPSNGGYFGFAIFDEPVIRTDMANPDLIPTKSKWEEDMLVCDSNLGRFNDAFDELHPNSRDAYFEQIFNMNDWGDHPLCLEINKYLAVEDFQEYNFGMPIEDLLGNYDLIQELFSDPEWVKGFMKRHTKWIYNEENDTIYARMTKFANPMMWKEKNKKRILNSIKDALILGDINLLAIHMGYRHEGESDDNMRVYDIREFNHETQESLEQKGYSVAGVNYSVDIDYTRVLTITPTILYRKEIELTPRQKFQLKTIDWMQKHYCYKTLIDQQIEIQAWGSGEFGQHNPLYLAQTKKAISSHHAKLHITTKINKIISVDDNTKWFLHALFTDNPIPGSILRVYDKTGMFDIISRQDWTTLGFSNGTLCNHPKNKALELDFKTCVKADISSKKRKTAGRTNYLDRIDSFENGFIPYLQYIIRRVTYETNL